MSIPISILGFSGSLRRGSYNTALLNMAIQQGPENVTFEIASLAEIPLYNKDIEDQEMPESVSVLRAKIRTADALLIATPEYNLSIPGVLKNAIDWVSRPPDQPFKGKPLALIGGGGMAGTKNAQTDLCRVAKALKMHVLDRELVTFPYVWKKLDQEQKVIDETIIKVIADHVAALVDFTLEMREG